MTEMRVTCVAAPSGFERLLERAGTLRSSLPRLDCYFTPDGEPEIRVANHGDGAGDWVFSDGD